MENIGGKGRPGNLTEAEREKKTPFHSVVWQQSPRVPFQVETPPPRDLAAQGSWSGKNDRNKVADAGKFRSMSRAGAALEPRWPADLSEDLCLLHFQLVFCPKDFRGSLSSLAIYCLVWTNKFPPMMAYSSKRNKPIRVCDG